MDNNKRNINRYFIYSGAIIPRIFSLFIILKYCNSLLTDCQLRCIHNSLCSFYDIILNKLEAYIIYLVLKILSKPCGDQFAFTFLVNLSFSKVMIIFLDEIVVQYWYSQINFIQFKKFCKFFLWKNKKKLSK